MLRIFDGEEDLANSMETVAVLFAPLFEQIALYHDMGDPTKLRVAAILNLCLRFEEAGLGEAEIIEIVHLAFKAKGGVSGQVFNPTTSDR